MSDRPVDRGLRYITHLGSETLLTIGHKPHCLWLMQQHVLRSFTKCHTKPATHLIDVVIAMGT